MLLAVKRNQLLINIITYANFKMLLLNKEARPQNLHTDNLIFAF